MSRKADWLVQHGRTWDSPPQGSITPNYAGLVTDNGAPAAYALTSWHDSADGLGATGMYDPYWSASHPESKDSMTAHRVMGYIHWLLWPTDSWTTLWAQDWWVKLHLRISLATQQEETIAVVHSSDYDLFNTPSANESYCWHHETSLVNLGESEWSGTPARRTPNFGTIRVNVKMRQRLEKPYVLALYLESRSMNPPTFTYPAQVDFLVQTNLRTYVTW